jgi:hypothetical protein
VRKGGKRRCKGFRWATWYHPARAACCCKPRAQRSVPFRVCCVLRRQRNLIHSLHYTIVTRQQIGFLSHSLWGCAGATRGRVVRCQGAFVAKVKRSS